MSANVLGSIGFGYGLTATRTRNDTDKDTRINVTAKGVRERARVLLDDRKRDSVQDSRVGARTQERDVFWRKRTSTAQYRNTLDAEWTARDADEHFVFPFSRSRGRFFARERQGYNPPLPCEIVSFNPFRLNNKQRKPLSEPGLIFRRRFFAYTLKRALRLRPPIGYIRNEDVSGYAMFYTFRVFDDRWWSTTSRDNGASVCFSTYKSITICYTQH